MSSRTHHPISPRPGAAPPSPGRGGLRLYGHRGAAAHFPENTLLSFREALAAGATDIETDVQVTRDGAVVVFHDEDGLRVAGQPARVDASAWSEVRRWDVGAGFAVAGGGHPFRGAGLTVPELVEALAQFPGTRFNIDIKPADPAAADRVVGAVNAAGAAERVLLTSFHRAVLTRLRTLGYPGPVGPTRGEIAALYLCPPAFARAQVLPAAVQIPVWWGVVPLARRRFIRRCQRRGLRVDFWVVNQPALARRLFALGADGVVTDDPHAIRPVFEEVAGAAHGV